MRFSGIIAVLIRCYNNITNTNNLVNYPSVNIYVRKLRKRFMFNIESKHSAGSINSFICYCKFRTLIF